MVVRDALTGAPGIRATADDYARAWKCVVSADVVLTMAGADQADAPVRLRISSQIVRSAGRRWARPTMEAAAQRPRIWKYQVLSTCRRLSGEPVRLQPVLFVGPGEVRLGEAVQFGWRNSPAFYTGYCHVETTTPEATISVGSRTEFNNGLMLKSEGPGITIGSDCLFGVNVEIFDSDFHDTDPVRRHDNTQRMAPVTIGDNVFVGMGVRILKGVTIGDDTVIGAGAVVASDVPPGVVAVGNPIRVIRYL